MKSFDSKQESRYIIYIETNNFYGYVKSKFLPTSRFKSIDPKEFFLNKYISNTLKWCAPIFDLECPKELHELHNDHPLAPDRIEIKREMLSEYQLKIADLYNFPIGNVKQFLSNFFDKKVYD